VKKHILKYAKKYISNGIIANLRNYRPITKSSGGSLKAAKRSSPRMEKSEVLLTLAFFQT
jgi:hypothetical protein